MTRAPPPGARADRCRRSAFPCGEGSGRRENSERSPSKRIVMLCVIVSKLLVSQTTPRHRVTTTLPLTAVEVVASEPNNGSCHIHGCHPLRRARPRALGGRSAPGARPRRSSCTPRYCRPPGRAFWLHGAPVRPLASTDLIAHRAGRSDRSTGSALNQPQRACASDHTIGCSRLTKLNFSTACTARARACGLGSRHPPCALEP